ncbi:hypothetical protein FO519_000781 [Halicephalobus sp. NKZ332]|nr:hypothetical protein FO519_000781 [Halicephalobus sp. NKZ332]
MLIERTYATANFTKYENEDYSIFINKIFGIFWVIFFVIAVFHGIMNLTVLSSDDYYQCVLNTVTEDVLKSNWQMVLLGICVLICLVFFISLLRTNIERRINMTKPGNNYKLSYSYQLRENTKSMRIMIWFSGLFLVSIVLYLYQVYSIHNTAALKSKFDSEYWIFQEANKLFELCDMEKKGYLIREDLEHLDGLISNLSTGDLDEFYLAADIDKKDKVERENFVKTITPFLLPKKTPVKSTRKHVKDLPRNMFKTISLDNDDSRQRTSSTGESSRKQKLSISLDEKLGEFNLINSQNPASIPKSFEYESEPHTFLDSEDFDNVPIGSPFFDRSFSFPDDFDFQSRSKIVSLKKRAEFENEEIEKRNHHTVQEVLRRSKMSLMDEDENLKPVRPSDFGPVSIIDHTVMEDVKTPERIFKVVFVGDSAVGKTCFLHRFCHNRFKPLFNATIGVDFTVKSIKLRDRLVAVQLWDTAGQERFRSITKQYFRKADSVVLMYDVTSEQSFLNVRNWIESVRVGVDDGCVMCLVGNKVDLVSNDTARKVSYKDGKEIAQEFDMLFFETSAYTGLGINDCMRAVAIRLQQREDDQLEEALRLEMTIQNSRSSWCCV